MGKEARDGPSDGFQQGDIKKSYFLGTIVLTTAQDDAMEVIDGQQRLATTTILIAAIRDYLLSIKRGYSCKLN